jgi:hypothetical protein
MKKRREIKKNTMHPRYLQLMVTKREINEEASNGVYSSKFVSVMCRKIQEEAKRYTNG